MTVIGTGYLGATHAACMAELGHEVLGVDCDPRKIERLRRGDVPFFEPGLADILRRHVESGRLRFTADYAEAAEFADIHFLGVGTPQQRGSHAADLSAVHSVIDTLAPLISRPSVIIGKSTVPVGTAATLAERVASLTDAEVTVCWNPEFLREGHAVDDTLHPDRLVLGLPTDSSRSLTVEALVRELYAEILAEGCPLFVTDLATAELVKVSANAFLATKISFINAISEVCEASGADVTVLADALGVDERIGRRFLNAGLGFGGGCLPKDIRAFMARAGELGADQALTFLREVDSVNMRRRDKVIEIAGRVCGGSGGGSVLGRRIAVLGAAFKPNSDDIRDSPALTVAGALNLKGALVTIYDPKAMDNAARAFPTLTFASSLRDAVADAEVVIVATEWEEFAKANPEELGKLVARREIIDARNCLPRLVWTRAGWRVHALGRPVAEPVPAAAPVREAEALVSAAAREPLTSTAVRR